jgi:cbb3-type cytochrome oxidase subunit 3
MLIGATVVGLIVLAILFVGLPYYQAYRRRKELQRRDQAGKQSNERNPEE